MTRADVVGTNLANANLSRSDLAGARLDRTVVTFTNFTGANMESATSMRPTIYSDLRIDWREAPTFDGANMRGSLLAGSTEHRSMARIYRT